MELRDRLFNAGSLSLSRFAKKARPEDLECLERAMKEHLEKEKPTKRGASRAA